MDFEEIRVPYGRANEHILAWHHPAPSQTLIVLIHGHNSRGDARWYLSLAHNLQKAGYAVVRYTVLREQVGEHAQLVMTVTEEIEQARVIVEHFKDEYERVVVAGHSQGGIIALDVAMNGLADGVVFLMSVMDANLHVESKLTRIGISRDELIRKKHFTYESATQGSVFVYTPAFFDDFEVWDVHGMLTEWYGPSLFIAGSEDVMVTPDEVEQGYSIANEPKEFFVIESEHNFTGNAVADITQKLLVWLETNGFHTEGEIH